MLTGTSRYTFIGCVQEETYHGTLFNGVSECRDCGAVVSNEDVHDEFHASFRIGLRGCDTIG